MGFLFPKAPKPVPPPNPAQPAPTNNPFQDPIRAGDSFIGTSTPSSSRKPGTMKTSMIGGN